MYFEKIKHVTCAKSLMAYAVNDTAKNWVAFITHPDSKILEPLLTSIPSFFVSIVSPRPYPIEVVSRHVVAAHQYPYLYGWADVLAHPPNRHTGQYHLTLQTGRVT